MISAGVNYLFITDYIENQQKIEQLEADAKFWEFSFRNFYFYANREWPEAERYAVNILIKAFSNKLAAENNWSIEFQLDWESDIEKGEAYVRKFLK